MPAHGQRRVANDRERKRTENLNKAFKQLQSIIPKEPSDKMSKINTLKLTLDYIQFLNDILNEEEDTCTSKPTEVVAAATGSAEADGNRSDSTLSTSPCGSTYYGAANQMSPPDRSADYDHQPQVKRRRPTVEPLQLAPQPTATPSAVYEPQTPNSDLPNHSPTFSEYNSFASYFADQYHGCPATDGSGYNGTSGTILYSGQHNNVFSPQHQQQHFTYPPKQDTSLLLRSAFRKYRMTRRKR